MTEIYMANDGWKAGEWKEGFQSAQNVKIGGRFDFTKRWRDRL